MNNFIRDWVPLINGTMLAVAAIFAVFKGVHEAKNLRRRNVKELLDLIAVVLNRLEIDSANADAKPAKGSFEDSLAKDLLVSHIFGRNITWSDYTEIRKFLTDHDNVN